MENVVNARPGRPKSAATTEEKALIERCKTGDLAAFNELVKKYEKQVYNFAYRLTGNYDDANDIAQDAFLRVYNAIGGFRGDASFTTWLFRITTNVFLDERKRARAHPHSSLDDYLELEESSVARQIEDPSPDAPSPDRRKRTRADSGKRDPLPARSTSGRWSSYITPSRSLTKRSPRSWICRLGQSKAVSTAPAWR